MREVLANERATNLFEKEFLQEVGGLTAATFGEPTQMLNKQNGVGAAQVYLLGGPRAAQMSGKIIF